MIILRVWETLPNPASCRIMVENQRVRDKVSEKLKDPNKVAQEIVWAIVEVDAERSDGVKLQAANKNPWYVLATIYGEQPEWANWVQNEGELAAENRRAWNLWFCQGLDDAELNKRTDDTGLNLADLRPNADSKKAAAELVDIKQRFKKRMQAVGVEKTVPPSPTEPIDFSHVNFRRIVNFSQFVFEQRCDFSRTTFNKFAYFEAAIFCADVQFSSVKFRTYAGFRSVKFCGEAFFYYAEFSSHIHFENAKFLWIADFRFSKLNGDTKFSRVVFENRADFRFVTFQYDVDFKSTEFKDTVNFSSAKFISRTYFDGSLFLTHVPEFHAAEIYDHTTFTLPEVYWESWPPVKVKRLVIKWDHTQKKMVMKKVPVMDAADQKRAYNRLRLFMNRSLQIDEEQFFHRMEMRCKREIEDSRRMRFLYDLFEGVSDFGSSVLRPAGWLLVVWLSGMIAKLKAVQGDWYPDWNSIPQAMGWSFANLFSFFGFYRRYFTGEDLNGVLDMFSGVQTVGGFVLLFMLGLGLRNRFRLR